MVDEIQGRVDAGGEQGARVAIVADESRVAVVAARFNEILVDRLVDGAVRAFVRHGGDASKADRLMVVRVPGSLELAVAARKLADSGKWDAVVCLGVVVRGETDHYEHVSSGAAHGVVEVAAQTGVPVIFGVITAQNVQQAMDRAGGHQGNMGEQAMVSALEMVGVMGQIKGGR